MKNPNNTDVLIIGGGPAGMVSAIYLDLLGISTIVLERRLEISKHPKAHELSARSIEILCQLGFTLDELKAEASPHEDASRILFGHTINHELGEIDLLAGGNDEKYKAHLASPEPYLNLSQTELEKLMRKRLTDCSKSQLLLGHQWESMEENNNTITSEVFDIEKKQNYSIKSKFVICADGAGSRSRKFLGIPMIGAEKINDFISVYFELNLRDYVKKPAKLYWIMNPAAPGTFIAHHIEKRWVYHFPIFTPHEKKEQFTEEILKDRILTALGDHSIPLEIDSISFWRMTSQVAHQFRKGRAFLVGDAAHRFPPTGGLGMNSGIGDVQNLCWKLAMVINGNANPRLLDSYESERRPVIELNTAESLRNYHKIWEVPKSMGLNPQALEWQAKVENSTIFKAIPKSWTNVLKKRLIKMLSKKVLAIPSQPKLHQKVKSVIKDQIEHFDRIGLDLGYFYKKGAIFFNESTYLPEQKVSQYEPSIEPGVRFPHFWIYQDGKKISSHDWLHPDKFTLLCDDEGEEWWNRNIENYSSRLKVIFKVVNVTRQLQSQPKDALEKAFYDIDGVPLLLVRPDGQIAWHPETLRVNIDLILNKLCLLNPIQSLA
ncbi:MAG: FAD-dependent monooxygenase [Bacteroidota bacterium]